MRNRGQIHNSSSGCGFLCHQLPTVLVTFKDKGPLVLNTRQANTHVSSQNSLGSSMDLIPDFPTVSQTLLPCTLSESLPGCMNLHVALFQAIPVIVILITCSMHILHIPKTGDRNGLRIRLA